MDPLSITASAFAIVGACRKLNSGFKFLKELSRAPKDILALTDELNALQNTLTAIGLVTRDRHNDLVGVLLTPLFHRVDHVIRELCDICGVCPERLAEVEENSYTDELRLQLLARFKWTRQKERVGQLREQLKVVRLDFANSLVTVSLLDISTVTSELKSLSIATKALNDRQARSQELPSENPPEYLVDDPSNMLIANMPCADEADLEAQIQSPCTISRERPTPQSLIAGFDTSSSHCKPVCGCACHRVYRIQSPQIFQNTLGSLLVKSSGLYGLTQPCNEFSCRRNPSTSMRISFRFPKWFLDRMISSVIVSNRLSGPQLSLVVPRVVPSASDIMFHAIAGNIDGIARLFELGLASPIDVTENYGYSALHYAVDRGHIDLCRFLLNAGARTDIPDLDENTVTDIAWNNICSNKIAPSKVAALQEMFKKDKWFEERQFSVLHKIVLDLLPTSKSLNEELSVSTSTIDLADTEGRTPLSWAAERGDTLAVKTLLRYGASLSSKSLGGMTPLHYAAKAPSSACLSLLLDNGACATAKNKWNQSPLNIACFFHDDSSFIGPLLDHGADINEKDFYTSTPLTCAAFTNNANTARFLISRGADINYPAQSGINVMNESIENNSHECISLALDSGVDLSIADQAGETPLHVVARCADLETLRIFHGADLEDVDPDARSNADRTARELFAQRVEVDADIEKAFQCLMGRMESGSAFVGFFDAVEKLPVSEKMVGVPRVTVKEVMVL